MLTEHPDLNSLNFAHGGNQDDMAVFQGQVKTDQCAGFINGKAVHVYISPEATEQQKREFFGFKLLCDSENPVDAAVIVSKAWMEFSKKVRS